MKYLRAILEIVELLRSIDQKLGSVIKPNSHDHGSRYYLRTGHWND